MIEAETCRGITLSLSIDRLAGGSMPRQFSSDGIHRSIGRLPSRATWFRSAASQV